MDLDNCREALLNGYVLLIFAKSLYKPSQSVPGELKYPLANLPRLIHSAMVVVITLLTLANAAFYIVLPLDVVQSTEAVTAIISIPIDANRRSLFFIYGD